MKTELNEKQKQAVCLGLGPAMILAGPGSGKTFVVLKRIEYLINNLHIPPEEILVITYTKAAAQEMKTRWINDFGTFRKNPIFATFHAYFYSVLKQIYPYRDYSIITDRQKEMILIKVFNVYYPDIKVSGFFAEDFYNCLSKEKNGILKEKDLESINFSKDKFLEVAQKVNRFCRELKLLDYDDILICTYQVLFNNETLLFNLKKKVKYILVDEFQDINPIQYKLMTLLAGEDKNLFVVGDDDQCIYRFRGAGEENLRNFQQDFCNANKIQLNINYRCPKIVLEVSKKLIAHNCKRFEKELLSAKSEKGNINCHCFLNKSAEHIYLVKKIREELEENKSQGKRKKVAVLCRTNREKNSLSYFFKKENIRCYEKQKKEFFYEKRFVKSLMGYLMFATGKDTGRRRLLTFLNAPMRGIGRECIEMWEDYGGRLSELPGLTKGEKEVFLKLEENMRVLRNLPPKAAVVYIQKVIKYDEYVRENCHSADEWAEAKENMENLKERAESYASLSDWMEDILWEEKGDTFCENDFKNEEKEADIYLYTFHGAKGLEFDTVFIPHLNEGNIPYGKDLTMEDMEEERRIFYVAMTRCKERLYISFTDNHTKKETVSRFIEESGLTVTKMPDLKGCKRTFG